MRVRHMHPFPNILRTLGVSDKPLNKYEIEKQGKIPRQSVYNWVPRLEARGLIRKVGSPEKSRADRPVYRYDLTEEGLKWLGGMVPDLPTKVETKYSKHLPVIRRRYQQKYLTYVTEARTRELEDIERWTELIRRVVRTGKASPGWGFRLEIATNEQGQIRYGIEVGFQHRSFKRHRLV